MKIQRGIVKYKQRDDIECMYCITNDGRQYYFLDATDTKKLKNGNRIVSTALVEAIDPMAKSSHIGVINAEGKEVSPCENKSIRQVDDDILIVEIAQPVSQSVIETINLRNDPLAATKLVSATADVKDRLNAKMGSNGRFLFNDLFSEAGLYDIDGKPLVDGYFSFIGLADRKLYLSKNNVDSEIVEYSIMPSEIKNNDVVSNGNNQLDVTSVSVSSDTIEDALNSYESGENQVEAGESQAVNNESHDSVSAVNEASEEVQQTAEPEQAMTPPVEETSEVAQQTVEPDQAMTPPIEESAYAANDITIPMVSEDDSVDVASESESVNNVPIASLETDLPPVEETAVDTAMDSVDEPTLPVQDSLSVEAPVVPGEIVETVGSNNEEDNSLVDNNAESITSQDELESDLTTTVPTAEEDVSTFEDVAESVVPDEQDNSLSEENNVNTGDVATSDVFVDNPTDTFVPEAHDRSLAVDDSTEGAFSDSVTDDTDAADSTDGVEDEDFESYDLDATDNVFGSGINPDTIESYNDEFESDYVTGSTPAESYGMSGAADTIRAFIGKVRNDKMQLRDYERRIYQYDKQIHDYERQIESFDSFKRDVEAKMALMKQKNAALSNKVRKSEATLIRFEDKIHDQEATIAEQSRVIASMQRQIKDSEEVLKLMPVLNEIVGDDNSYSPEKRYGRVA